MDTDIPTVVSGQNVHFTYDMPSSSKKNKNKKKKSKSPAKAVQHADSPSSFEAGSILGAIQPQVEIYDEKADYPTSRVIRRAANGRVIVEALPTDNATAQQPHQQQQQQKNNATSGKLVAHWESLSPEEKRRILSIRKEEVFSVTKKYQTLHNCDCSVCGMRSISMEQELESIYNQLFEAAKQKDPNSDSVLFHLNLIKELHRATIDSPEQLANSLHVKSKTFLDNMRDEAVRYCISSNGADKLKDEVIQFKHKKQKQHLMQQQMMQRKIVLQPSHSHDFQTSASVVEQDEAVVAADKREPSQEDGIESISNVPIEGLPAGDDKTSNEELRGKYMKFAQTFVSSHPKIAQEYVNRMMMYPDMRALTEDLMKNNGRDFVKAVEAYVSSREEGEINGEGEELGSTKMTAEEFQDFQKQIIENTQNDMTDKISEQALKPFEENIDTSLNSDTEARAKRLFEQFMAGETFLHKAIDKFSESVRKNPTTLSLSNSRKSQVAYECEDNGNFSDSYDDYDESPYEDDEYGEEGVDSFEEDESGCQPESHEDEEQVDDYDSDIDHQERLEEGRGLIQIAITKLLQNRLLASYQEKQAERNRERLLMELEAEEQQKREKVEKKQKKKEKEKEKKRQQQLAKEEEKRKQMGEEARLQMEAEARERERRENQRKMVEEAKKKKDMEARKRLEEQRRREEEQERQRKLKEDIKRKREEERKQREEEQRRKKMLAKKSKKSLMDENKQKQGEEQYEDQDKLEAPELDNKSSELPENNNTVKSASKTLEVTPYRIGNSTQLEFSDEKSVSDDICNMINEATSKSISASPSQLNSLLQSSLSRRSNVDTTSNLSAVTSTFLQNPLGFPAGSSESGSFNPPLQPQTVMPLSLSQTSTTAWDTSNLTQNTVDRNQISSQKTVPSSTVIPGQHRAIYSAYTPTIDPNNSLKDELDNLTSYLSQTGLQDNKDHPRSLSPTSSGVNMTDPSVYGNTLWNSEKSHISGLIPNNLSSPVATQPQLNPRRSIWDTDAINPTNHAADIWRSTSSNSTTVVPSTALATSVTSLPFPSISDVIYRSYYVITNSGSYVPIDQLYQTCLSFITDKASLTYTQFVTQLLNMRTTLEFELVTNDTGTITHCRIPPSKLQSNLFAHQITNNMTTTPAVTPAVTPADVPQHSTTTGLFNDSFGPISNGGLSTMPVMAPQQSFVGSTTPSNPISLGHPASGQSSFLDFNQPFTSTTRTSNIWG
ncbi:HFL301Wp [Eremothecium sinecaudum]|uniref:Stress response protein NST1 n=1 Tax=Eremothecium sinecaudum TaxID=45286 RepID=A0A120K2H7_9SACH|nr:HFL301Wp [Eremothecium sinecaudum]AMD21555.1 HFL301Wp [Eremothecium sinecaudum]